MAPVSPRRSRARTVAPAAQSGTAAANRPIVLAPANDNAAPLWRRVRGGVLALLVIAAACAALLMSGR